jgi:hypothetical protein
MMKNGRQAELVERLIGAIFRRTLRLDQAGGRIAAQDQLAFDAVVPRAEAIGFARGAARYARQTVHGEVGGAELGRQVIRQPERQRIVHGAGSKIPVRPCGL